MLMPASSEFIALCRSQVGLLTQGLGAALSIIYLTEELTEATDTTLVPVVAYPDVVATWGDDRLFSLLSQGRDPTPTSAQLLLESSEAAIIPLTLPATAAEDAVEDDEAMHLQAAETALLRQQQMVLPLMYQDVVMGLLVTARSDRAWNSSEQSQIEQIAETLAIACLLDQRAQWFAQDRCQQELLQEQKHDLFDNLLHQFRNPLTALRTFGKLLAKRLKPSDSNHSIAEGIVRESDRLQELLQQFDAVIDLDEQEWQRLNAAGPPDRAASSEDLAIGVIDHSLQPTFAAETGPERAAPPLLPGSGVLWGQSTEMVPSLIMTVLHPLLESASAIAQDRHLTLEIDIPADLPPVRINLPALREVLTNLLDNALKYTPAGGRIAVWVLSEVGEPPQQAIVIADTGPGIPPQDLEHLFERHYRGVQSQTDIPGTGLGLAIARELVHQMQGTIEVFSPAQTSGFVLPVAPSERNLPGTAVVVRLPEATQPA
jgi:signal transduction histidine kinase